ITSQRESVLRSAVLHVHEGGSDLDGIAAQVIGDKKESEEVRIALLEALAAPGTKAGTKAAAWAMESLKEKRKGAIAAVGRLRPAKADEALAALLDGDEREAALAAIRDAALLEKWAEKEPAALRSLARVAPAKAAPLARKQKDAEALGRSAEGAKEAAKLVLAGKWGTRAEAARALRRHAPKDAEAARLLAALVE
ncbi:MAG: hypothetical protein K2W96_18425, partial [Gemmataceae bacterium]|nr:hypothetical protein [Gemmataceae bacterium]